MTSCHPAAMFEPDKVQVQFARRDCPQAGCCLFWRYRLLRFSTGAPFAAEVHFIPGDTQCMFVYQMTPGAHKTPDGVHTPLLRLIATRA